MFIAAKEKMLKRLNSETEIERQMLSHLNVGDDIMLFATALHQVLEELNHEEQNDGKKVNRKK